MKIVIREITITLLMALVLFLAFITRYKTREVISGSMLPTLSIGERVVHQQAGIQIRPPAAAGRYNSIHPPASVNSDKDYIKRIIGLPGEDRQNTGRKRVHPQTGWHAYQAERALYAGAPSYTYTSPVIPPGKYFVMGDNRNDSSDSHTG